jgi:2-methylisocitrate lyase-like PEP mutase family enzyme
MDTRFGQNLRRALHKTDIQSFIGVYDVFSAAIAARHYDGLFLSGFSFAASYYGLPDIGFIAWSDIVAFTQRVRTVLPHHHLMVDIDDGYGDAEIACHVVSLLEAVGASGVVLEDQKRPRLCGHFSGKQLLELNEYIHKLNRVLATRKDLFVVARTDATDRDESMARALAFAKTGVDAILVEALPDLQLIHDLKKQIDRPLMFNQIAGGKSPPCSLQELKDAGVSLVNYSTPCLFAAQSAIDETLKVLKDQDGVLQTPAKGGIGVEGCTAILNDNLARRDNHERRKGNGRVKKVVGISR